MTDEILLKYLNHTCTPEELRQVEAWITEDKANALRLFDMERIWSVKDEIRYSRTSTLNSAYDSFIDNVGRKESISIQKKSFLIWNWFKYVAAVTIIVLLGINLYKRDTPIPSAAMNLIEVPAGQRASITLSDGTLVWLNSGTSFRYPSSFARDSRQVYLEGEGYFEVLPNQHSPFLIHTGSMNVKVLGTKFNLKAYKNENSSVTLAEGSVEVSLEKGEDRLVLKPNEQATYSEEAGLELIENVDAYAICQWTAGELLFTREPLANILLALERRFDVQISIRDVELLEERFTCRAQADATLEQVLDLLRDTRKLNYKINGKTIIITKK